MSHVGKCDCMTRHVLRKVTAPHDTLERVTSAWRDTCPRAPAESKVARTWLRAVWARRSAARDDGRGQGCWLAGRVHSRVMEPSTITPLLWCLGPAVVGWSNVWSLWKCSIPIGIVPPNQAQTINLSVSNNNNVYVENINMAFVSMFDHPNLNMSTSVFVNVSSLSVFSIRKYLQWGLWPTSSRQICTEYRVYQIHWPMIGAHTFVVLG